MTRSSEAASALPDDAEEFGRLLEEHRRDLVVLSYRFLGSLADAEDAAQETALRAWRARDTYRGEAGVRTWLHRIATRVCLDAIDKRSRRVMPEQLGASADPIQPPDRTPNEVLWLEPLPDAYVADVELEPDARYSLRESVSLAFTSALQLLPARQRAVLLLRDVLCWRASETASVLGTTTPAVNSALNRARMSLQEAMDAGAPTLTHSISSADQLLLERYMRAWETDDIDGLVDILREEVRLAMPPSIAWYGGRPAVAEFLRNWILPMGPFRMQATGANLQPAAVLLGRAPDGSFAPVGVHVLTFVDGRVQIIDAFMDPEIAVRFG